MAIAAFVVVGCALLAATETLKRRFAVPAALTRKIAHVGGALIAAVAPLYLAPATIIGIALLWGAALFWATSRKLFASLASHDRKTLGEVWLPLGIAASAYLFLPHDLSAYLFGILVMGVADAAAGVVGDQWGTHRIVFGRKSLEGAGAFFVSTLGIGFYFLPGEPLALTFVALLLTLIELVLVFGLDNLVIPVVAGLLLQSL